MKKAVSVSLIILMLLAALCSCQIKDPGKGGADGSTDAVTTQKQFQSYDELEYKSEKRFSYEDIYRFNHKNGSFLAEKGTMTCITENGAGFSAPLDASDIVTYEGLTAGCGAAYGQSIEDVCNSYSLDIGYAAFAGSDGSIKMYESADSIETSSRGGCLYVGYALDPKGEWAFMDFEMLKSVMLNQLIVQNTQSEYVVSVLMITFDSQKSVSMITQLYGPLNHVMQLISSVAK